MMQALRNFNDHIEHLAELVLVLIVGFMLPHTRFDWPTVSFLILLFAVIRPLSVWIGLKGVSISRAQRAMISWFPGTSSGSITPLSRSTYHGGSSGIASAASPCGLKQGRWNPCESILQPKYPGRGSPKSNGDKSVAAANLPVRSN